MYFRLETVSLFTYFFSTVSRYLILSAESRLVNAKNLSHWQVFYVGILRNDEQYPSPLSGGDHIFMLIPAPPPSLILTRMRKVNIEPGKLAITLFIT
jgi:hypothetical protein